MLLEARGELDVAHARFYTASCLCAFQFLASLSIVYRDLKPDNLMLTASGELRVIDLGFTKVTPSHRLTQTPTRQTHEAVDKYEQHPVMPALFGHVL